MNEQLVTPKVLQSHTVILVAPSLPPSCHPYKTITLYKLPLQTCSPLPSSFSLSDSERVTVLIGAYLRVNTSLTIVANGMSLL